MGLPTFNARGQGMVLPSVPGHQLASGQSSEEMVIKVPSGLESKVIPPITMYGPCGGSDRKGAEWDGVREEMG